MSRLDIPHALWQDQHIILPACLVDALRAELQARGLYRRACEEKPDKSILGGENAEDAIAHFTFLFKTSAARVEFVMLNPNGAFEPVSNNLLACLFDGKISILDIPCGSGG